MNKSIPAPARMMLTQLKIQNAESSSARWDELEAEMESQLAAYPGHGAESIRAAFAKIRSEAELGRTLRAATRAIANSSFELVDDAEQDEDLGVCNLFRLRLDTGDVAFLFSKHPEPTSSCPSCRRKLQAVSTTELRIAHKRNCSALT